MDILSNGIGFSYNSTGAVLILKLNQNLASFDLNIIGVKYE